VAEQRHDELGGLVARCSERGDSCRDCEGRARSWVGECSLQPGDGQRVDAGVRICHSDGERAGSFGANIRIGVAEERDERAGELELAEMADERGGVAPLLPGAGEQPSNAAWQVLVVEGSNGGGENRGSSAERKAK
jgi:hypothetical protein